MKKFTIAEALKKGVDAARLGKRTDADKLFTAILKVQPDHAHANHNMGALGISIGKIEEALPFLRRALEVQPTFPQFWLTYLDALTELKRWTELKSAIDEAYQSGISALSLTAYERRLAKVIAKGQSEGLAELSGKERKNLLRLYNEKRFTEALEQTDHYLEAYPDSFLLHNIRGASLVGLKRFSEAISSYDNALRLRPGSAEAHNNLGVAIKESGDLEGAILSFEKALELDPNFAEPLSNLAGIHKNLGNTKKAFSFARKALKINPSLFEANTNLGNLLVEQGKYLEAIEKYKDALLSQPNSREILYNLGLAFKEAKFEKFDSVLATQVLTLLRSNGLVSPISICRSALSLLRHNTLVKEVLLNQMDISVTYLCQKLVNLVEVPLLLEIMSLCPILDTEFEQRLTTIRSAILLEISKVDQSASLLAFQTALALQCFNNEYIFAVTKNEQTAIQVLEQTILKKLSQGTIPSCSEVLCLASYTPLNTYTWVSDILFTEESKRVELQQIIEPSIEQKLRHQLPTLQPIENNVSSKVRTQYEQNPYPCWKKTRLAIRPSTISEICKEINLVLFNNTINLVKNPSILIAGCGTGRHAVETLSRFDNSTVLAVDLSLNSLAYAQRKTNELGLNNIHYMQADILNLKQLNRTFDIIECSGVLHHMSDPFKGWKELVKCLKSGGLMKIGLYSSLARRHITKARLEISNKTINPSLDSIKSFRNRLLDSLEPHHVTLSHSPDFYSTSTLRDLVFHVQEHCFSLSQIKTHLKKLNLKFCGFENQTILKQFRRIYSEDTDRVNLDLWDLYENENPTTFEGMYQFWCQKL